MAQLWINCTKTDENRDIIMVSELNPDFKYEVSEYPGGENIRLCFACGTCSAGCPVREIDERYNPRKIIRMVLLGMRDRVLSSEFIWFCSTCYTCRERCPQGVRLIDVMTALKNIAVKEGYIHPLYKEQIKLLDKSGAIYEVDNRRRERSGLPFIQVRSEDTSQILKLTGLSNIVASEEGHEG